MSDQIIIGGEARTLGWVPPHEAVNLVCGAPLYDIPKQYWSPFELVNATEVKDQGSRGACNGHAAASTLELCYWIGIGTDHPIPLSAWFIYANLCGGWDRGSCIGDALVWLQKNGTCSDNLVQYSTINPRLLTEAAKADAVNHKISQGAALTEWDEICNAVQLRRPVNLSVRATSAWNNVDSNGVPPIANGTGNHAVAVGWGMRFVDGDWQIKMQNSWGTRWGVNGYCWLTRQHWEGQNYKEAYYVESASMVPGTEPPVLIA
jgi:hypothetical protein